MSEQPPRNPRDSDEPDSYESMPPLEGETSPLEPEPQYGAGGDDLDWANEERPAADRSAAPSSVVAVTLTRRAASRCQVDPASDAEVGRLWGHVFFAADAAPPRTVIVTSAARKDGATQIAVSLALHGAASNRELRVALVDFNLRDPRIAEVLEIESQPGLTDVLANRAELNDAMQAVVLDGGAELHVLTAGAPPAQPIGLLRSRQAQALVRRLAEVYDHVIIDVPSANAYPDPQIVGALVDGAVLVARSGRTPREAAAEAKKRLEFAGVRCLGLVLNQRMDPVPGLLYRTM